MIEAEARVALITGSRRGLGFATAEALARQGYRVIVTARGQADAEEAAGQLRAAGLTAEGAELDVGSDESVAARFAWLDSTYGRLDVLVNNAGTIFEAGWDQNQTFTIPASLVLKALDNNALSAYRLLQLAVPRMNAVGYGRVVNVSSGMGGLTEMGGGHPAYRLSKVSMNALTRIFHAAAGNNVKVNSVCPGWVRTEMGGSKAPRSIEQGIQGIVWAATLPDDGPSGGFFRDGKPIPW